MLTIKVKESKYMRGDYSLFLSFPYNERMINIIRGFSERSWIKQSKEWEVPIDMLDEILEIFSNQDIEIEGRYIDLTPREEVTDIDFSFKTTPFEHQKESFLYGMNHDKWFLGDQMGLGKTKQAIDIAVALKETRGFTHCLIICGVNGLKWNWRNEIATHSNEECHILGQKIKKKTGEIYIGSNKDKLYDVEHLESISAYFIITNVETLRDDKIVAGLSQIFASKTMCIVDEAHKCFSYETPVMTDCGYIRIGDIVENKLDVKIASYNFSTNTVEYKNIVGYHNNIIAEPFIKLKLQTDRGIKEIRCTKSHKFYTYNRGWVEAQYLTVDDDICEYAIDFEPLVQ